MSGAAGAAAKAGVGAGAAVPRCAWCGAAATPVGPRLVECAGCGAATTYPVPDDAELAAAYGGAYRPAAGRFSLGADRLLARTRGALARRVDAAAPPGPVLDVGAGDGSLLDALGRCGREALGLERFGAAGGRSPDAAGGATSARPDVLDAELARFEQRRGEWAAVVMWHSLEHLGDPAGGLDRACELLAPGGLLVVAAPNRASWQARVLGARWLALDLPRHLVHLSSAALTGRLRDRGLVIERVSYWRGGQVVFGWLHGLVAALPGHPDLYDAVRRPAARFAPMSARRRALALVAGAALAPLAVVLSVAEIAAGAGGTVMVEARR